MFVPLLVLRNLFRNKLRTLLTALGIVVAIARALISDPTLIVADEPTGDLDRVTAGEILGLLERLNDELGKTILMVTHDPKAAAFGSRQIHLEKGEQRLGFPQDTLLKLFFLSLEDHR